MKPTKRTLIAGDSHGCFSHLQQSELFLCWLCDMPNTETKVPVRGIPVLLLPYCTELDHIEVQMNQILPALVPLLMQGRCAVTLVCLYLDAAWESFLPVCAHPFLIQLSPHQAPSQLWSEAKSLWMSLTSGSCAAAAQRRMGHGNLAQCWAVLPWREGIHPLMEGKHGNGETFIICARRTFICLSKTEPHFEEDTGGWSDGTEDRKHSQAGAFNSPDRFISLSTSQGSPVYCCYSEQVLDCNVPAAPLFWVFSTFRLFHRMSQIQKEISQSHGSYVLTQQHCSGSLKKKKKGMSFVIVRNWKISQKHFF